MSARKRRRKPHSRPSGERVQRTEPATIWALHWWWAWLGCLVLAAVASIALGVSSASMVVGNGLAAALCWMTGCADGGMALIGWALALVPVMLVLVACFLFPRSGPRGRVVLLALGTVTFTFVVLMLPDPRDRMSGDGSAFLADGMLWGPAPSPWAPCCWLSAWASTGCSPVPGSSRFCA